MPAFTLPIFANVFRSTMTTDAGIAIHRVPSPEFGDGKKAGSPFQAGHFAHDLAGIDIHHVDVILPADVSEPCIASIVM